MKHQKYKLKYEYTTIRHEVSVFKVQLRDVKASCDEVQLVLCTWRIGFDRFNLLITHFAWLRVSETITLYFFWESLCENCEKKDLTLSK